MRFEIKEGPYLEDPGCHSQLDSLLRRVEEGVHELRIVDVEGVLRSSFVTESRPTVRLLVQRLAQNSAYLGTRRTGVHSYELKISDKAGAHHARAMADTPLQVALENDVSDGALVDIARRLYGSKALNSLWGSDSNPRPLEVISRGGIGELRKLVDASAQHRLQGRPLRMVIVCDSDAEYPGQVKDEQQRIRDICSQASIPLFVLAKRTVENYIPDAFWTELAKRSDQIGRGPAVAALLQLGVEQRDHVKLDRANVQPWNDNVPEVSRLFNGVPATAKTLLRVSDFKGRGSSMIIIAVRDAELSAAVHETRDHSIELRELVRMIEENL